MTNQNVNSLIHGIKKERRKKVTDAQIIEALRASRGIHQGAANWLQKNKRIIVDRSTISKRIAASKRLKEIATEIDELTLDAVQSKLMQLIDENDKTCIIFYLKCKGKSRGFTEKVETTIANGEGEAFKVSVKDSEMDKMTLDELMALARESHENKVRMKNGNA